MSKIYRRADGRWAATVNFRRDGSDKLGRKTIYGRTKDDVRVKVAKFVSNGPPPENAGQDSVATYLRRWLESSKGRIGVGTWTRYEELLRLHVMPHIGKRRLSQLQPSHIAWLYDEHRRQGLPPATSKKAGITLSTALSDAVARKLIAANPSIGIKKPRVPKPEMKFLTQPELRKLLDAAAGHRLSAVFVLAGTCGVRQGELFGLQWGDVDFDRGTLSIRRALKEVSKKRWLEDCKTDGSRRTITLPAPALAALAEHRKAMLAEGHIDSHVFCDTAGGWLRKSNFRRNAHNPILKAAGVPRVRFHDLRHTAASLLLAEGVPVTFVSQLLGHSNPHITLTTYAHAMPGQESAAADAMTRIMGRA